jgi:hypothetical protein
MTPEDEEKLLQQDSKTLAVTIIVNRVLGGYKKEAKKCMIELMRRRLTGDKFEFEKFIEDGSNEYKIEVNTNLFGDLKKQLLSSIARDFVKGIKANKNE